MASVNQPRQAMPNFRTARLVGIFNVFFSAQLLLCGICMGGYVVSIPLWVGLMDRVQQQTESRMKAVRQSELAALDSQEKAATTAVEKAVIAARREDLAKRPLSNLPPTMDMKKLGLTDPTSIAWSWTEVLSGIVVNVLLLASGIGLLHWKPWARRLGVWTAVLKVVRLTALYSLFIVAIVPTVAKNMGEMVVQMAAQQQGPLPAGPGGMSAVTMFVRVYMVVYSVMGAGMIVLGSIYPLLVLWLLTRPGVKSACSGAFLLPREPGQPC